jgi:periplasmic divalent cation tolerance protein
MTEFIVVLVTASNQKEAEAIANDLVTARLVACANIIGGVHSLFHWKGKIAKEQEVLIIMKSRGEFFERIEKRVRQVHSYDVPEIIALPLLKGSTPYLDWLRQETS